MSVPPIRRQRLSASMAQALAWAIDGLVRRTSFVYMASVNNDTEKVDVDSAVYQLDDLNYVMLTRDGHVNVTRAGKNALAHWKTMKELNGGEDPAVD